MDSYSVITHNKYLPFFQRKRISDRPRLRLRFSGCIGFIKLNNIQLFYSKQIKTKEFTSLVTKKTERAGIRTPDNLIKSQVVKVPLTLTNTHFSDYLYDENQILYFIGILQTLLYRSFFRYLHRCKIPKKEHCFSQPLAFLFTEYISKPKLPHLICR